MEQARLMYFQGLPVSQISKDTGIPNKTLKTWIHGDQRKELSDAQKLGTWKRQRELGCAALTEAYIEGKKQILPVVLRNGLNLIDNGFRERLSRIENEPITIAEAKQIADIIGALDKIIRLDAGDPTEITESTRRTIPATLEDLKRALEKDPFIETITLRDEIKDAEYRVIDGLPEEDKTGDKRGDNQHNGIPIRESSDTNSSEVQQRREPHLCGRSEVLRTTDSADDRDNPTEREGTASNADPLGVAPRKTEEQSPSG